MAFSGSGKVAEIFVELGVSTDELDDIGQRVENKMQPAAKAMRRTGRTMTKAITAPLAAISGAAVKTAADFDSEFAKIRGLVDASEDVDSLKSSVLDLAGETARSPQKLAQGLFFVESAGFRGAEAMDVLEASAKAAAAGLGQTKTVADAVTSVVNAYGQENISATEATDTLVATVREGKVQSNELAGSLGRVIPIASEMGVEFEDVGASIAALTRLGANSRRSVTALSATLRTLLKPTEGAKEQLNEVGLSMGDLREQVRGGDIIGVLQRLKKAFDGNTQAMTEVFPNARALRGVLGLVGKSADQARQIMENMEDTTGDTQKAFDIMSQQTLFQLNQAWTELKAVMIEWGQFVGASFMPIIKGLSGALKTVRDAWASLSPALQQAVGIFVGLAAAAGPVLWLIGSLVPGVYALSTAFTYLAPAASAAWAAITGPLGAIIGGIAATAAGVWAIIDNWEALSTFFSNLFTGIGKMIKGFGTGVGKFMSFVAQKIKKTLVDAAVTVLSGINSALQSLGIDTFRDTIDGAIQSLTGMSNKTKSELEKTKKEGQAAFDRMSDGASTFAGNVVEQTGKATNSLIGMLTDAEEETSKLFGGGGAGGSFTVPQSGSGGGGGGKGGSISDEMQETAQATQETNNALKDTKSTLDRVREQFSLMSDTSQEMSGSVRGTFSKLSNDIVGLDEEMRGVAARMEQLSGRTKVAFQGAIQAGQRFAGQVGQGVGQIVADLVTMQSEIKSIGDLFRSIGQVVRNAIRSIIQMLVRAIVKAVILKAVMSALGLSGGGAAAGGQIIDSVSGIAGGSGGPAMAAEGGVVPAEPTSIIAGENNEREAIMPLSKLDNMLQATQSQGGGGINVVIEPRTTPNGDIKYAERKGASRRRRIGAKRTGKNAR